MHAILITNCFAAVTITNDSVQFQMRGVNTLLSGTCLLFFAMWVVVMVKAYHGKPFKLPIVGGLAARWAGDPVGMNFCTPILLALCNCRKIAITLKTTLRGFERYGLFTAVDFRFARQPPRIRNQPVPVLGRKGLLSIAIPTWV